MGTPHIHVSDNSEEVHEFSYQHGIKCLLFDTQLQDTCIRNNYKETQGRKSGHAG